MAKSFISLLAMIILIAAGVSACSYLLLQTQIFHYIDVGVVIPEEEKQTKQIAQYISSMDSVQSVCNFKYMEFEAAMDELNNNEVQAVILLPENFYEDLDTGKNTPATIYLPEDAQLNVEVFQELFLDGVAIIQIAESGIYASLDTARYQKAQMKQRDIANFVFSLYLESALSREDIFDSYTESPFGQMSVYQYYLSVFLTVVLLMMGLNFGFLYQGQGKAVEEKLRMYGIGAGKKSVIKILVMTGILWTLGILMYLLLCGATGIWSDLGVWIDGRSIGWMFFLCLSIASFFHIVYTVSGGGFQGTIFLMAVNIGMILCSGAILPMAYFPDIIGKIGMYLPFHFWHEYSTGVLFGKIGILEILAALGFSGTGIGVGVVLKCKDM